MLDKSILDKYNYWLKNADQDPQLIEELNNMKKDEELINDAFYRDLAFGTGGLRGVIGAGTNRMNIYVIRKASQGLANYINKHYKNPSIAISYDSRIKSDLFAKEAARIFIKNNIKVSIYDELMPTPCLSYAVRKLNCSAGIMVTASHNPSKYNGYKVYDHNGCQITDNAANEILSEINKTDPFKDKNILSFEEGLKLGLISFINQEVKDDFTNDILNLSVTKGELFDKNVKIVYSPLHGTGLKPVISALNLAGYRNIKVVKSQELPDGYFTTCPYPNPEIKEAMLEGINYAKEIDAELFFATDPDADRIGIAIKDGNDYKLLTGNQVGILLLDFICKMKIKNKTMPLNPVVVRSLVTNSLTDKIAEHYGVKTVKVLTGFKYIGDFINNLEKENKTSSYILGYEESYGYLSGTHVRDKDAVNGALLIVEMFAYYKQQGKSLLTVLEEIYNEYGYCLNKLESFEFEGQVGQMKLDNLMNKLKKESNSIGDISFLKKIDYSLGVDNLPKTNMIYFELNDGSSIIIRPSGTEPKIKIYYEIHSKLLSEANDKYANLSQKLKKYLLSE